MSPVCLMRFVFLVVVGVMAPGGAAAAKPAPAEIAFRKRAAERYLQYCKAVREHVLTPERCPFSPAAVVMLAGAEPAELAEWVRQHIAYEPYAGVVRGAEGTLAAGAGGDWDRAVLLQSLLAEAGYKSRLRILTRTPQEQAAVVDGFLKGPATIADWFTSSDAAPSTARTRDPLLLVRQFGAVPENRALYARQEAARVRQLLDEALDAGAHEMPLLLAALEPVTRVGQSFDAWRAMLLMAAAERVELEVLGANGTATSLSVAPDAAPVEASRLSSARVLNAPPAEMIARLSIRLELTAGEEGKPAAAPVKLIDRTLAIGTLFSRPIRLEIVPSDDAAAAKATATWTKEDWAKFISGFRNFQAILRVGDEWEGSKAFDLDGRVHSVLADGRVEGATQISGAVGQGFGSGLFGGGGGEVTAAKPTSWIESLVLVMELSLPGAKPQVQQRLIFGRERNDVTPVFTADALVTAGPVNAHAISWLLLDATTRNAPLASRLVTSDDPRRFEQTEDAVRLPVMLYDWHAVRLMVADRLARADAGLTFHAGPSMVTHLTHVTIPTDKNVATRHAVDVAFDTSLLLPRSSDKAATAVSANATFGVAATVLESGLLRVINPAHGVRGAYWAFEEARAAGVPPVAISSGGDVSSVKLNPLVSWSLARNESGRSLLFPGGERPRAWWSVDPATGMTIGRGDGGEGQSAMEYLQITKKNVDNLKCMVGLSNQILGGDSGQKQAQQWFMCMTGTDNPGSGHGIPGAVEGGLDSDLKAINSLDLGFGPLADALGGAKDLYDIMNNDNPVLFTGR